MGLGLLALVGVTALGSSYLSHHHYNQFVMAARSGLDGPDIDLLERENKGYERIMRQGQGTFVVIPDQTEEK